MSCPLSKQSFNVMQFFSPFLLTQCYHLTQWASESVRLFFGISTYLFLYLGPILIHIYCYGRILYVIFRQKNFQTSSDSTKKRAQIKTIKLLLIVVLAYIACFSWNMNIILLYCLGIDLDFQSWSYNLSVILTYLNCLVNPIIYVFFYKQYRQQLVKILKRMLCCD